MPRLSDYDYGDRFNKEDRDAMTDLGYTRRQQRNYAKNRVAKEHMSGGQLRRAGHLKDHVGDIGDYDARGVAGQGANINDKKRAGWTRQDIEYLRKQGGFSDADIAAKMQSDMDTGDFRMGKKAKAFMGGDYSFGKPRRGGGRRGGGGGRGSGNTTGSGNTHNENMHNTNDSYNTDDSYNIDDSYNTDNRNSGNTDIDTDLQYSNNSNNTTLQTDNSKSWINSGNEINTNISNSGNTNANQSNNSNVVGDNNSVSNNQNVQGGGFNANVGNMGGGNSANSYMNNYKDGVKQNMFGGAFSSGIFS